MKTLFTVLCFTVVQVWAASAPSDELSQLLVGTWQSQPISDKHPIGQSTYFADGTGIEMVPKKDPSAPLTRVSLKWRIKDKVLILTSVSSSDPDHVPVGVEIQDRIVSLTAEQFVFEPVAGYPGETPKRITVFRKKPVG